MKVILQAIVMTGIASLLLHGQQEDGPKSVKLQWVPLNIAKSHFPRSIGMMDAEREDYANNLAGVAVMQLLSARADAQSRETARQMIALALHLSPRNRRAVILNAQLGRGVVPDPPQNDYQPKTLARLLMNRARLLEKQGGEGNIDLAGYLFSLACDLDPKSEDAIYYGELHRINHGEADWKQLLANKE